MATLEEPPGMATAIPIIMLVAGILNVVFGLWGMVAWSFYVLGTYGIGLLCCWTLLLPIGVGVFEIVAGGMGMSKGPRKWYLFVAIAGIIAPLFSLAYCSVFGLVPMVGEIIALVFLLLPDTQEWLRKAEEHDADMAPAPA